MRDDSDGAGFIPAEEMVTASELREFVYCERAWWLSRDRHAVSSAAQALRDDGVAFHEARAGAARRVTEARALWWAFSWC